MPKGHPGFCNAPRNFHLPGKICEMSAKEIEASVIVRHPVADAFTRTRNDLLNSTPQFPEFTLNAPREIARSLGMNEGEEL